MKKNTQTTLAEALQLSRTTVARALSNSPKVSESTKKAIMDKARELGYIQPSARKQTAEKTKEIVLLAHINALRTFFWIDLIHEMEQYLKSKKINIRLALIDIEQIKLGNPLPQSSFSGVQCVAIIGNIPNTYYSSIRQQGLSIVSFDKPIEMTSLQPDFDVISLNNTEGIYFLTKRAIEKGCKKLVFAGDKHSSTDFYERYMGFEEALKTNNLEPIHINSLESIKSSSSTVKSDPFVAELSVIKPSDRPDAYICANDAIAESITDFREQHPDLFGEAIFTGFDNVADSTSIDGTIDPHIKQIGKLMGFQIYNRIENPDLPHTIQRLNVTPIFNERLK